MMQWGPHRNLTLNMNLVQLFLILSTSECTSRAYTIHLWLFLNGSSARHACSMRVIARNLMYVENKRWFKTKKKKLVELTRLICRKKWNTLGNVILRGRRLSSGDNRKRAAWDAPECEAEISPTTMSLLRKLLCCRLCLRRLRRRVWLRCRVCYRWGRQTGLSISLHRRTRYPTPLKNQLHISATKRGTTSTLLTLILCAAETVTGCDPERSPKKLRLGCCCSAMDSLAVGRCRKGMRMFQKRRAENDWVFWEWWDGPGGTVGA